MRDAKQPANNFLAQVTPEFEDVASLGFGEFGLAIGLATSLCSVLDAITGILDLGVPAKVQKAVVGAPPVVVAGLLVAIGFANKSTQYFTANEKCAPFSMHPGGELEVAVAAEVQRQQPVTPHTPNSASIRDPVVPFVSDYISPLLWCSRYTR